MADMSKTKLSLGPDPRTGSGGPAYRARVSASNNPATSLPYSVDVGAPVATDPVGEDNDVILARANAADTSQVSGLAFTAGEYPGNVNVQYSGPLSLSTDEWDARTGQTGGLTPQAIYYLSAATPGKLTSTPPANPNYVTPVGYAMSATTLMINIGLTAQANP